MKIQFGSDLHREFLRNSIEGVRGYPRLSPEAQMRADNFGTGAHFYFDYAGDDIDVLVLAGDIEYMRRFEDYDVIFNEALTLARHVLFVPGNHDFWRSRLCKVHELQMRYASNPNIHILYNEIAEIDGVNFYGGTQWSRLDPAWDFLYQRQLNDFKKIKLFRPDDMRREHKKFCNGLLNKSRERDIDVVVSHFLPCTKSIHAKYKHDTFMNGYYCTDMLPYMYNVKLWIHGHTHEQLDYTVYDTRVVCNPHGYLGFEPAVNLFDRSRVVEI